jgi:hypothetical protein
MHMAATIQHTLSPLDSIFTGYRRLLGLAGIAGLAFFLAAPASAQSSGAAPIEGDHHIYVDGDTISLGTISVSSEDGDDSEEGGGLVITSSPLGTGTLELDGDAWHATFSSGFTAEFTYDSSTACYEFTVNETVLTGFLTPADSTDEPLGPTDPQGQGPRGGIGSFAPGSIDIWSIWPPWLNPYIQTVDFYQFVTIHIRTLRTNPSGGEPLPGELPPGTTVRTSGNGGAHPTQEQAQHGAGMQLVDGSTMYVDSRSNNGNPGYITGGGAGGITSGSCGMSDDPSVIVNAVAPLLMGLPNPFEIIGVDIEMDFRTYLVVNGQATYVWHWVWHQVIRFDHPLPYDLPTVTHSPGMPVTGFDPVDFAAVLNFIDGGFSGAPIL